MVKTGTERSDKYGAKFDAEVVRSRFTATSTLAKAKATNHANNLASVAASVRAILNLTTIPAMLTVPFQAFGNKLYGICNKLAGYPDTPALSTPAKQRAQAAYTEFKTATTGIAGSATALQDIWKIFKDCIGSAPSPL